MGFFRELRRSASSSGAASRADPALVELRAAVKQSCTSKLDRPNIHSNMRVIELMNRFGMMVAEEGCREIGKRMTYFDSPKKQWLALYLWQHVKHKCPNLKEAFFVREVDALVDRLACMQPKNVEQSKVKAFAQIVRSGAPPKELPGTQNPYGHGAGSAMGANQGGVGYGERPMGYYGEQRQLGYDRRMAPDTVGHDYLEGPSRSASFPSYARQQEKEKILKDLRSCTEAAYDHSALLQEIMDAEVEEEVTEETLEELLESCEQILTDVNDLADKASNFPFPDVERALGELLAAGDELSEAFGDFQEFLRDQILNNEPPAKQMPQLEYEVEEDDRLPPPKIKKLPEPKKSKPVKEPLAIEPAKKKKGVKALPSTKPPAKSKKELPALPPPPPEPIKPPSLPPSQEPATKAPKLPELPEPPAAEPEPNSDLADLLSLDGPTPPMEQDQASGDMLIAGIDGMSLGAPESNGGNSSHDAFGERPFGAPANQLLQAQGMYGGQPGGSQGYQQMGGYLPAAPGQQANNQQPHYGGGTTAHQNPALALPPIQDHQQPMPGYHAPYEGSGMGRTAQSQPMQAGSGVDAPVGSTDIVLASARPAASGSQAIVPLPESGGHKKNNPFASSFAGKARPPARSNESAPDPFSSLQSNLPKSSQGPSMGPGGSTPQFSASMGPPKSYYAAPATYGIQSPPSVGTPMHGGSPLQMQYGGMGGNPAMQAHPAGVQSPPVQAGHGMAPGGFAVPQGQYQAGWRGGPQAQQGTNIHPNMPGNYPGGSGMSGFYSGGN